MDIGKSEGTQMRKHLIVAAIALLLTVANLIMAYMLAQDRNCYRDRYHEVSREYRKLIKETGR